MTNEHALELVRRWQESRDEAAATELVKGHRRAIFFVVRRYVYVPRPAWITSDDLEAVATEALIETATKFDPACGCSFITAAVYRMRGRISARVLKFLAAKRRQCRIVSLEAPVGEDGAVVGDFVPDTAIGVADALREVELRERLEWALRSLPRRYQRVLRLRFGVGIETPATLKAVGAELGCTVQRVCQMEARALRMLRHPTRSRQLKELAGR